MSRAWLAAAAAASIGLIGAATQNVDPVTAPPPPSERPPHVAAVDDAFAIAATQGSDAEIEAARLALARSSTDDVKSFARLMLHDHGQIAAEGKPLIAPHLVHPPASLAAPDVLAIESLTRVSPVAFEQQYAMLQIGDHLAAEAAFAAEARDGRDPALRAFAKKWYPTIQAHLELAVTLVKHVGGDSPFK